MARQYRTTRTVQLGSQPVDYGYVRTVGRRSAHIVLDPVRGLEVRVPYHFSAREADRLLKAHEQWVLATLAEICATRTNAEWSELLGNSNVPHGPVNTLEDLLEDEQLNATGYWQEMDHPTEGRLRMPGIAPRFSRTPPEIRRLQPNLGEHSVEILGEAGFSASEIEAMVNAGVTVDGQR